MFDKMRGADRFLASGVEDTSCRTRLDHHWIRALEVASARGPACPIGPAHPGPPPSREQRVRAATRRWRVARHASGRRPGRDRAGLRPGGLRTRRRVADRYQCSQRRPPPAHRRPLRTHQRHGRPQDPWLVLGPGGGAGEPELRGSAGGGGGLAVGGARGNPGDGERRDQDEQGPPGLALRVAAYRRPYSMAVASGVARRPYSVADASVLTLKYLGPSCAARAVSALLPPPLAESTC